jgi:hypothetical protein
LWPRDSSLPRWQAVVAGAIFVLACVALFRFTAEDAFIVQRYAFQLVRGHGLVFNIGERVSALTSPLQALVLAALTVIVPSGPMIAYKAVGMFAALAAILFAGYRLFDDASERAVFLSATLTSPFVALWSVGGLETPLLLGCITVTATLALVAAVRLLSGPELLAFWLTAAAAFLLRHDSGVFVGPLAAAVLARQWRASVPGAIAGGLAIAAWIGSAWLYYGDIFPTSFYAKVVEARPPVLGGIGYELSFGTLCLLPLLLLRWPSWRGLPLEAWLSVALFSILAAFVSHVHMMFGYRFFVPMLPALVVYAMRITRPLTRARHVGVVPPLVANLALFWIVATYTINPTIFHPALFEPHYGFLSRQANRGLAYEYTKESAWAYGDFIDALRRTGRAVLEDARARGIPHSASLATIIAGATPNEIPDIYVYDHLVGVRRNCPTLKREETYQAADYVEFMVPRFGSLDALLAMLNGEAIRVSDVEFEFDRVHTHLFAYFNPSARHTPVPLKLNDPCPPGR